MTPESRRHWEEEGSVIPDGNDRSGPLAPYPLYIARADGPYLYDVDGREIVDFVSGNMGGLLGHNNPQVREAVAQQLHRGTNFSMSPDCELHLAQMIVDRIPSVDKVRFTTSGSEATMYALRLARAHTGRVKIAKMDGGFHGSHDAVWVGLARHHAQGPGRLAPGIPPRIEEEVLILPFNDLERTGDLLKSNGDQLAAVIVEPVLGAAGSIPATPAYLRLLREMTSALGIVLVFDEMISLGLGMGGAQELFGVLPDITTAGKTVSAGVPMAFYGGRRDIMDLTGRGAAGEVPRVLHTGTYISHGLAMVAGIAALEQMTPEFFVRLHQLGETMRHELTAMATRRGFPLRVVGIGHMWGWFWADDEIHNYQDVLTSNGMIVGAAQTDLLNRNFFVGPSRGIVNGVHSLKHVERLVAGMENALDAVVG